MIIADTSGLLAHLNADDPDHGPCAAVVESTDETLVVSPFVLAELDYLVATRFGVDAELTMLEELTGGAYELAQLSPQEVEDCATVIARYRDQEIGIADASLVVLANRCGTRRILTLDHQHFTVVRPLSGGHFSLLPDPVP